MMAEELIARQQSGEAVTVAEATACLASYQGGAFAANVAANTLFNLWWAAVTEERGTI